VGSTIRDVAGAAGVSLKTVSNVLHDHPHVRASTRERVLRAIAEVGYRPNLSARGLRSGRTGVIGLVVPALRENYFAELADAVIRSAARRGVSVLVEQTGGEHEAELLAITGTSRPHFVDGLLFSPISLTQADASALETTMPVVLLGERIFGGPTDHVAMHNVSSARAAVDHLIDIGRRRIAVIGADPAAESAGDPSSATLRTRGYRQALENAGIEVDPRLIRTCEHWSRATGAAATRALLDERVEFDAVFALNDTLGLGTLRTLGAAGVAVPDDVAVVGFDNIEESEYSTPSLTTVDAGRDQIADRAVELLLERVGPQPSTAPPQTVKPDFRIVRRESTGFPGPDAG
jgi:DNA-binding LacI/PurR family transcriptional regulator